MLIPTIIIVSFKNRQRFNIPILLDQVHHTFDSIGCSRHFHWISFGPSPNSSEQSSKEIRGRSLAEPKKIKKSIKT